MELTIVIGKEAKHVHVNTHSQCVTYTGFCHKNLPLDRNYIKRAHGVSPQFFFIWTWVLNHNSYVEIKQFSKVDIKQDNVSNIILLIKFLVYQWDPRHLQGSRVVYTFVYIMKFVFCLISIHIFVFINHEDTF